MKTEEERMPTFGLLINQQNNLMILEFNQLRPPTKSGGV
ncbi:hypothetical protein PEDI_12790 [Persicobacter diffluens]|uniref:Uncharacterized protein n=1 Tax=Persicobacter diffluens TaxID=981 RepID=A0AAN4VWI5_9BACT|nr:hypothetical protein PEDI_12790 [Persicobacter diffluens]